MSDHRDALWQIAETCMKSRTQSKRMVQIHVNAMMALGLTEGQREARLAQGRANMIEGIERRRGKVAADIEAKRIMPKVFVPPEGPPYMPERHDFAHASTWGAAETIDAVMFTGDPDEAERKAIRWFSVRWQKRIKELRDIEAEVGNDN